MVMEVVTVAAMVDIRRDTVVMAMEVVTAAVMATKVTATEVVMEVVTKVTAMEVVTEAAMVIKVMANKTLANGLSGLKILIYYLIIASQSLSLD